MVRKNDARGVKVDWAAVERATEIPRSYEINLESGGIIFKMFKKSEMSEKLRHQKTNPRLKKWKNIQMVGVKV